MCVKSFNLKHIAIAGNSSSILHFVFVRKMDKMETVHENSDRNKRRRLEKVCKMKAKMKTNDCLLHNYFNLSEGGRNAIIFDNGKGLVETLKYRELDQGADLVKNVLLKMLILSNEKVLNGCQEFIGVNCDLGRLYPILILGILRSGNAFYNIEQNDNNIETSMMDGIQHLGMKIILVGGTHAGIKATLACKVEEMRIDIGSRGDEDLKFQVYKVVNQEETQTQRYSTKTFAYAIQTSGTTGRKKTIMVPHKCICPNIEDFAILSWKVTENDVVFGSAPPTFDPHIVELFSALAVGATILYTTPEVKLNASLFANVLVSHCVTILQITPCLFRRLCSFISKTSLKMPYLRIIAFGGEKCVEKQELQEMKMNFPNKNILYQNVYGVTEVSCWASVANIDIHSPEPVTIGTGLADTAVRLDAEPEGEIVISSLNRHCVIIDPAVSTTKEITLLPPYEYRTGDMGILTPNGIIFQGRKDRVVKRNGMKVSLYQIELMTLSTGLVSYAECNLHEGRIYLVVKLKNEYNTITTSSQNGMSLLPRALGSKLELPLFMYPDHIISLTENNMPLNGNGKIDFDYILKSFVSSLCSTEQLASFEVTNEHIIQTLLPVWKSCTCSPTCEKDILQENFTDSGGTSISAARFIESTFMALKLFGSEIHQKWEQRLLLYLLNNNEGTFGGFVEKMLKIISESSDTVKASLSNFETDLLPEVQEVLSPDVGVLCNSTEFHFMDNLDDNSDDDLVIFNEVETICDKVNFKKHYCAQSPLEPAAFYKFSMGLCVDASPSVVPFRNQVIIGCHGGNLLCLDLNVLRDNHATPTSAIVWERKFPNGIEANVEIHPNSLYAYVGCHDGNFYKFSAANGEILSWTSGSGEGAPIRSKCAISGDFVIFLDSANSIYCVDAYVLNKLWSVNAYKLLATLSPVIFRGRCLLPTLEKGVIALDITSGNLLWNTFDGNSTNLIYSSPTLLNCTRSPIKSRHVSIFVCASNEGIEARDSKSGILLWRRHKTLNRVIQLLQPIFNKCCDNIIWIESITTDSSKMEILDSETGKILATHQLVHSGPIAPSLVYTECCSQQRKCHLIYKRTVISEKDTALPYLVSVPLHEIVSNPKNTYRENEITTVSVKSQAKVQAVQQWNMDTEVDFETFSKPIVCSEFILFGGRDNNLHVVKMKV